MLGVCWWTLFTLAGIWGQHFLPGVDLLAPGLLISLQEQRPSTTAWLAAVWILLQEGTGTLFFGSTLLVYGALTLGYLIGKNLFDTRSLTLMCLLGLLAGAAHFSVSFMIMGLEHMAAPVHRLLMESALQAALLPGLWYVASQLFPEGLKYDERAA